MTIDDCGSDVPWNRYDWSGNFVSIDGANTADFTRDDIDRVIAFGQTDPSDWDGESAGIVKLKDGRYVSWESDWGPTGSGFCCDAYGGTADIMFATTEQAARLGISEKHRELLKEAA